MRKGIFHLVTGTALAVALSASSAYAQKKYDTGATDTEIKLGQTNPFSGPASSYATIGKTQAAYMKMINDQGGVNGRKINLIQYDDAYSPPKAVEQVRKLVESDEVLLTFQVLGTPSNAAVQKYLNSKKVPQLFAATGASKFTDPKNFPWTMGFNPNYFVEGRIYGQYILKEHPNAKIGILYQKDDAGMKKYFEFMAKYYPDGDKDSSFNSYGYMTTELLIHVLKACGDNLTRENVLKQATHLKNVQLDLLLPGISVSTTPDDYRVNKQLQMMKFNGERWEMFGPILEDKGAAG